MAWSRIDDSLHSHPKIMQVGNAATGLFVRLISYAGQHLTDGFVPASVARAYGTPRLLNALCDANLLTKVDPKSNHTSETHPPMQGPGYVIHDYLDYNPSREQVLAERSKNAARQEAFRQRRRGKPLPPDGTDERPRNEGSNGVTHGATNGAPTRPDPNPSRNGGEGRERSAGSDQRAREPHSLITPNWQPTEHDRAAAAADITRLGPTAIASATAKFVRHHQARGTTAADFGPLWQTWLTRERPDTQGAFLVGLPGGATPTPPSFAERMAALDATAEADRARDRETGETG